VDIADGTRFVRSGIEHMALERYLVRAGGSPGLDGSQADNRGDSHIASSGRSTSTWKLPGRILRCGRPPGSAAGTISTSAAGRKTRFVRGSKAMVLAVGCVMTGPRSSYWSADFWRNIFRRPSPLEKKIVRESGS